MTKIITTISDTNGEWGGCVLASLTFYGEELPAIAGDDVGYPGASEAVSRGEEVISAEATQQGCDFIFYFTLWCISHTLTIGAWLDLVKSFIKIFIRGNTKDIPTASRIVRAKKDPPKRVNLTIFVMAILLGIYPVADGSRRR